MPARVTLATSSLPCKARVNADAVACNSATAAALPAIAGSCGSVADAKKNQSAGFATGVSQASGVSCTDATNDAFNTLFEGCTGTIEISALFVAVLTSE
jgi:hypothetical protein